MFGPLTLLSFNELRADFEEDGVIPVEDDSYGEWCWLPLDQLRAQRPGQDPFRGFATSWSAPLPITNSVATSVLTPDTTHTLDEGLVSPRPYWWRYSAMR